MTKPLLVTKIGTSDEIVIRDKIGTCGEIGVYDENPKLRLEQKRRNFSIVIGPNCDDFNVTISSQMALFVVVRELFQYKQEERRVKFDKSIIDLGNSNDAKNVKFRN